MQGRHGRNIPLRGWIGLPAATQTHDPLFGTKQLLGCRAAQKDQHFGIDQLDMAMDERTHHFALVKAGLAIARRAPWQDIGDIGICAVPLDRGHHLVQQLPCAAHEGKALHILIPPRRFTDKHQVRFWIAISENQIFGRKLQATAIKTGEIGLKFFQRFGAYRSLASFFHLTASTRHHSARCHGRMVCRMG